LILIFAAVNACHGDSGGSFAIQRNTGKWYIRGVVSFGMVQTLIINNVAEKTCSEKSPSLFTDLAGSIDWILQTVQTPKTQNNS
jgi:secreted trypsin-like serine protease